MSAIILISSNLALAANNNADPNHLTLAPVKWKGDQWEYLVEHPTDVRHIDPVRFEELLDEAGQHGWELVAVTGTGHFYAFYFKRPLSPEKLAKHRQHILVIKKARLIKRKAMQDQIDQEIEKQKQYQQQLQKTTQAIKQETQAEKSLDQAVKQEDRDLKQETRDENQDKIATNADTESLKRKLAIEKQLDQTLKQIKQDEVMVKQKNK